MCWFALALFLVDSAHAQTTTYYKYGIKVSPYPGYVGALAASFTGLDLMFDDTLRSMNLTFSNLEADPACDGTIGDQPNSCGIHFHAGTSCDNATNVGGHLFQSANDPWTNVTYHTGSGSHSNITTNLTRAQTVGHAFVIHDFFGSRIACTVLSELDERFGITEIVPYFSTTTDMALFTDTEVDIFYTDANTTWTLSGNVSGDPACVSGPSTAPNSCGIHIHEGYSCNADAGGHLYATATDPWTNIVYTAGPFSHTLQTGVPKYSTVLRTLIFHNHAGDRIACSLVQNYVVFLQTGVPAVTDLTVYPGSTSAIQPSVGSIAPHFPVPRPGALLLSYFDLAADADCVSLGADLSKDNSCGIHLHAGYDCPTGGHLFSIATDPWGVVRYDRMTGASLVFYGLSFEDTVGASAVVVHDRAGNRISCNVFGMALDSALVHFPSCFVWAVLSLLALQ